MADDEPYANIRELLGWMAGTTILEVTQHDKDEFDEDGETFVSLHLNNGATVTFYTGRCGCDHPAFSVENGPDDDDGE